MRPLPGTAAAVLASALVLAAGCDAILGIPGHLDPLPDGGHGGNGGDGGGGGLPGGLVLHDGRLAAVRAPTSTSSGAPALRVTGAAFETAGTCAKIATQNVCVRGGLTAEGTTGR